jgi:hypothetical protein
MGRHEGTIISLFFLFFIFIFFYRFADFLGSMTAAVLHYAWANPLSGFALNNIPLYKHAANRTH